jgi:hypothetical protein
MRGRIADGSQGKRIAPAFFHAYRISCAGFYLAGIGRRRGKEVCDSPCGITAPTEDSHP